jgi:RNA polymerase-binding transcription factor DksA
VTDAELETYRGRLLRLGSRIHTDFSSLAGEALRTAGGEPSGNLSNTPMHLADLGTDNFEQEMSLGFLENQDHVLEEIRAALDRVERRTFGRCERCQKGIGKERLDAVPYTRYCIACAREVERNPTEATTS